MAQIDYVAFILFFLIILIILSPIEYYYSFCLLVANSLLGLSIFFRLIKNCLALRFAISVYYLFMCAVKCYSIKYETGFSFISSSFNNSTLGCKSLDDLQPTNSNLKKESPDLLEAQEKINLAKNLKKKQIDELMSQVEKLNQEIDNLILQKELERDKIIIDIENKIKEKGKKQLIIKIAKICEEQDIENKIRAKQEDKKILEKEKLILEKDHQIKKKQKEELIANINKKIEDIEKERDKIIIDIKNKIKEKEKDQINYLEIAEIFKEPHIEKRIKSKHLDNLIDEKELELDKLMDKIEKIIAEIK